MQLSRREFVGLGAGLLGVGAIGTGLYEPYETAITQVDIRLKRLPPAFQGLRIAQLSDLHFNPFMTAPHLSQVVELTKAQKPDLVILTGDYVTFSRTSARKARAEQAWPCGEILKGIAPPLGCYAVLGNHDFHTDAEVVTRALGEAGKIKVLRNQSAAIERDGARLWLAGVDSASVRRARPDEALNGVPKDECTIVALHEPDFADVMARYPVDFQISGHSHGGQIRFPLMGAVYLPRGARKYPQGHYRIGDLQLYTNRGLGVIVLPMRFLCPPEITIFTLKTM